MPASKYMLSRYQVINACFLTKYKKYWSIADLLNKLEENDISISIRTLKEDIAVMRLDDTLRYHAPIEYCAINKGYYYTDPEYSINRIALNDEELEILLTAINMIKAYKNINALGNFQSIVEKVVGHVNRRMVSAKAAVPEIESVCYIPKAINDRINSLMEAIRKKEVIKICLNDTHLYKQERELFLHPYTLSTDQEHWYIIGLRDSDHIHIFLQLDWITDVASTEKRYIPFVYESRRFR
jgi:predicted DNA-binding transcriptional regulator YafY